MSTTGEDNIDNTDWPEAMATVTSCKYEFGAGQALAFGIPMTNHFRISYNYFAGSELCSGQFSSPRAIPQDHLFQIRYNPAAPAEHTRKIEGYEL